MPSKQLSFNFNYVTLAPNEQIGLHQQSSWELSYVITGSGIRIIGDMREPFQFGEVIMIPPDIPHSWFFNKDDIDSDGRISNITVTFTNEFLTNCSSIFPELSKYIERLKMIHNAVKFDKRSANLISSILKAMCNESDAERLASMIKLLTIISSTDDARVIVEYKKINKEQERLQMIQTYIICNAYHDISLNDIAHYVGMNRSAFCIFFRKNTGKTFVSHLNEYRIELACQLLIQKNMSVSEICYHVGFTNIPYFNRTFKKIKGCSPTKFSSDHKN